MKVNKKYYDPHIAEARESLVAMLAAIDTGNTMISLQSGTELKATVNEPKTLSVFVRMELADARVAE